MKNFLLLLFLLPVFASAQKLSDYGFDKVRIVDTGKIIQAETKPVSSPPNVHSDRLYFWYAANKIHSTEGGFSGRLLNGSYNEFYPDKNLREQGNFKKGLKDGVWKSWDEDGTLDSSSKWKNGLEMPDSTAPIWKKLPFLKKKKSKTTASPPKPN